MFIFQGITRVRMQYENKDFEICCQRSCDARVWSRGSLYRLWLKITHRITKQGTRHFVYVESLAGKSLNSSPLPLPPSLPIYFPLCYFSFHFNSSPPPLPPSLDSLIKFLFSLINKHCLTKKNQKNIKRQKWKQTKKFKTMSTNMIFIFIWRNFCFFFISKRYYTPSPSNVSPPSNLHNLISKSELNMKHPKT